MSNHGTITLGRIPTDAAEHALLLEWACTVYWRAAAIGTPRVLDEAQQAAFIDAVVARNYGSVQGRDR